MTSDVAIPVNGVLRGVRVIDLTQNVAGPYCTQILGDMGAEVIKIERPVVGDDTRAWMPTACGEQSATFLALNRNKKSLSVDLDQAQGREIVKQLVRDSDVIVHSLKPGSAEARGLGYEDLRAINPKLVYCAISAFGQQGPMRGLPGYDPLMQAFTGIMSVTGSEGDAPARVSVSLIDMGTGMWAAMGILAALREVERSGAGTTVEASLMETGVGWMTLFIANYRASGNLPKKMGTAVAMTAPYELFEAADGAVFIAAGNNRLFRKVCEALVLSDLPADARFADNPQRVAHRNDLHRLIEARTRELTAQDIERRLHAHGAPCSAMNNVEQMLASEQVNAAGIVQALPMAPDDTHRVVGLPFTIAGLRRSQHAAPPALGQNTREMLVSIGYGENDIDQLVEQGVVR